MRHPGHGIKLFLLRRNSARRAYAHSPTLHPRIGCYNKPHDLTALPAVVSPVHVLPQTGDHRRTNVTMMAAATSATTTINTFHVQPSFPNIPGTKAGIDVASSSLPR